MKFDVFLSPIAEKKLDLILEYLIVEWGVSSKEKYIKKLKQVVGQISTHPKSCQESEEMKGVYRCIVTRQSSFYYRILTNEIEIITFFDNRQNQESVFEELKTKFFRS